ncbi:uncharacterized protein LOC143881088 [Tasmannia lanceolata]|uniref:uncharacterized protein LOC143881088 n=1 Tax=Tasmannia lanceolata TaxID=3420 RepID=UPI004063135B
MELRDGNSGGLDSRERHKMAERERRKSMRELLLSLHSLLPHSNTVRKEQSIILDEIIKYIPLAVSQLRSLQARKHASLSPSPNLSSSSSPAIFIPDSGECEILFSPEPTSSIAICVRGDHVNVSLTIDVKANSQPIPLSDVLDELEAHHLDLIRSTHFRDGTKFIHHSETKICDGLDRSPAMLKERLQDLACKLNKLRIQSSLKRSFDQIA